MLLGDADVVEALGELLLERQQAGGAGHGGGDRDDLAVTARRGHECLGEDLGVLALGGRGGGGRGGRAAGGRVEQADVVQVLLVVALGRGVAAALLGHYMHHDGAVFVRSGVAERRLHGCDVVTVDGTHVAHAERLEEGRRLPHLAHRCGGAVDAAPHAVAQRHPVEQMVHRPSALHVVGRLAQPRHHGGQPAHRGRIGAAVVVQHDQRPLRVVAEVVQRLEGHAAGHRAVADHGHHPPMLMTGQAEACCQARCPAQRRGCVAVLHDVMGRLGSAGVAREPVPLAQLGEAVPPAGDELVDVGLMAGVPDDHVTRRLEHAVQRHAQLHSAEVRPEVAAGAGDRLHDELPDLGAQLVELRTAERSQVRRARQLLKVHARPKGTLRLSRMAKPWPERPVSAANKSGK